MKNIEIIGKGTGLAIALGHFLFFPESELYQWVFFGLILATVGIPHGALDHLLVTPEIDNKGLLRFILKYVLVIVGYLIVWIALPTLALLAFIVMSAYHFGQSHFIDFTIKKLEMLTYLTLGAFYLSIVFWGDFTYTAIILNNIVEVENLKPYGIFIIGFLGISALYLIGINLPEKLFYFAMEMTVLGLVLYFLPLLLGFVIYFGFWHAVPSMSEEYASLKNYLGQNKIRSFVLKMLPFTTISLFGIVMILVFFYTSMPQNDLILLFFILISLISAPHIWFMNRFLNSRKS